MQIWRCPNARIGYSINSRLALRGTPISYAQFGIVSGGCVGATRGDASLTLSSLLAIGNVVRKTWTYLVRTCHTTNDVVCHHVANRFVPLRLSGGTCHLSSGCSTVAPQGGEGGKER